MAPKDAFSKKFSKGNPEDPDEVEARLERKGNIRHEHGGHEHSDDWDEWEKADRELRSKSKKAKRSHSKPLEPEE